MRAQAQGFFSLSQPCLRCGGTGHVIEHPCVNCGGRGSTQRLRRYAVPIPAGIKDGARIRLRGKGEAGSHGAPAGDLFVQVTVEPSPVFTRRGDDLVVDVPVLFSEAAAGATIDVPAPDGERVRLKLKAGTADGVLLRARGRGAPKNGDSGKRGDLLARVHISVPRKLSRAQKEALEKFAALDGDDPRADLFARAAEASMIDQTPEVRHLGRGGVRRHAPADAAPLRGPAAGRAAPLGRAAGGSTPTPISRGSRASRR